MSAYEAIIGLNKPIAIQSRSYFAPPTLDGIVTYLKAARKGNSSPPGPDSLRKGLEIPIDLDGSTHPYYRASAMWADEPRYLGVYGWVRSRDWLDPGYELTKEKSDTFRKTPHRGSGKYRQWQQALLLLHTPRLRFWFCGDKDKVEDLLGDLTHIGVRRAAGFGRVSFVLIRKSADYSVFDHNNNPARPVPILEVSNPKNNWSRDYTRSTPPYWFPEDRTMCFVPPPYRWLTQSKQPPFLETEEDEDREGDSSENN